MNKIKVVLPSSIKYTLERDMERFGKRKPNGEINGNDFLCNVAIRMYKEKNKEKEIYYNFFSSMLREELADGIADAAILLKNKNLPGRFTRYIENYSFILYPNKSNSDDFLDIEINGAGKKNTALSAYFRNLFDEYCSKSQVEREKIYFNDIIDKLNKAQISNKVCLLTYKGKKYGVAIEHLDEDRNNSHLYAFAIDIKNNNPIAFRIDKISQVIIIDETYNTGPNEWDSVEARWCSGDLESEDELFEIVFELTKNGVMKFEKRHNRNLIIDYKKINNLYHCTETEQFFFDFFASYANDIKIISPQSVIDKFHNFHKQIHENFNE